MLNKIHNHCTIYDHITAAVESDASSHRLTQTEKYENIFLELKILTENSPLVCIEFSLFLLRTFFFCPFF